MDLFVVDLDKTATYQMRFGCLTLSDCHYLAECPRNNPLALFGAGAHHCVGLATPSLPIRENGSIVAV